MSKIYNYFHYSYGILNPETHEEQINTALEWIDWRGLIYGPVLSK